MKNQENLDGAGADDIVRVVIYENNRELMLEDEEGNSLDEYNTFQHLVHLMYENDLNPTKRFANEPLYDGDDNLVALVTSADGEPDEVAKHVARVELIGTIH